tara:strand:+ start:113 stop:511 length:399 start_codon:yes stop_codon:yes gene_type:complete
LTINGLYLKVEVTGKKILGLFLEPRTEKRGLRLPKGKNADPELLGLKNKLLASLREGDVETAADTLLEVWAHHGIINGNIQFLDRFAVGSGLVGGLKERKRVASMLANQMSRALDSVEAKELEPDYESRLSQ